MAPCEKSIARLRLLFEPKAKTRHGLHVIAERAQPRTERENVIVQGFAGERKIFSMRALDNLVAAKRPVGPACQKLQNRELLIGKRNRLIDDVDFQSRRVEAQRAIARSGRPPREKVLIEHRIDAARDQAGRRRRSNIGH